MAGYSIVLNLTGNAVSRANRLANALERANVAAKSLATTLPMINSAANGGGLSAMRGLSPAQIRAAGSANSASVVASNAAASARVASARANVSAARTRATERRQTRHPATRIASFGTGLSLGPFSARLSSIFQADANGKIMGMNAASLAKGLNVTAIVGSLTASIGKAMMKVVAFSTIAPLVIAGGGVAIAIKTLMSESFAEGVRLISRRHQSKNILGEQYGKAEGNADFLASSYGLDRSTSLSSIATMTGLAVGGKKNNLLSLGQATGLTKTAGLISQHHGVPFERVATNIQQLLVQTTPHMRDIREMLNQAPALAGYARRDMERTGSKETDVRQYLKNQDAILRTLNSYTLDVGTNAGMQARGEIGLAKQDAMANIAGNDKFWSYIGTAGSAIINSLGNTANSLMTELANNDAFQVMVQRLEDTLDMLATDGVSFFGKLISLIEGLAKKWDIELVDGRESANKVFQRNTLEEAFNSPTEKWKRYNVLKEEGYFNGVAPQDRVKKFEEFDAIALKKFKRNKELLGSVEAVGHMYDADHALRPYKTIEREIDGKKVQVPINNQSLFPLQGALSGDRSMEFMFPHERATQNRWTTTYTNAQPVPEGLYAYTPKKDGKPMVTGADMDNKNTNLLSKMFGWVWGGGKDGYAANPTNPAAQYRLPVSKMQTATVELARELNKRDTNIINPFAKTTQTTVDAGSDLSGMNRDRRSLEIHFHNKLVEWNSTINAANPKETVNTIAKDMEQLVSAAFQKAMQGASNKMQSAWE